MLIAALKYTISLGADTLIPPGNALRFRFGVEHIDEIFYSPLTEAGENLLLKRLDLVRDRPFFNTDEYPRHTV